jgi:uridine kinase
MIGDQIELNPEYLLTADKISTKIFSRLVLLNERKRMIISIYGESGSGKSTLAKGLALILSKKGFNSEVLHMDDYFVLPPHTNHLARENDISHVGKSEVDLHLLDTHLALLQNVEVTSLTKPLSDNVNNCILSERIDLIDTKVIIVEGTYVGFLNIPECKIFINRDYRHTYDDRVKRARDPISPFTETVLAIEHEIVRSIKNKADIIVQKDFTVM